MGGDCGGGGAGRLVFRCNSWSCGSVRGRLGRLGAFAVGFGDGGRHGGDCVGDACKMGDVVVAYKIPPLAKKDETSETIGKWNKSGKKGNHVAAF